MKAAKLAVWAAAGLVGVSTSARAEWAAYEVDPVRSSLTLSGAVRFGFSNSNFGFVEVGPGSLVTAFGGQIVGDLSGGVLALGGGSAVVGLENPAGPFLPLTPGGVDNYGAFTFAAGGAVANNRFFDLGLDLTGGTVADGLPTTLSVVYRAGSSMITPFITGDQLPQPMTGASGVNTSAGLARLVEVGGVETLTIPVDVLILVGVAGFPNVEVRTQLTGTIVAVRAIPEPGAVGLLVLSGVMVLRRRR